MRKYNYDFYHPNNILIWDGKNLDTLKDFLDSPYVAVDTQIREKYSFGNWIRYILKKAPTSRSNSSTAPLNTIYMRS
jgi:hypothetical protein